MSTLKKAVATAYAGQSELQLQDGQARIGLVLDGSRGTVALRGTVAAPALLRDALMTTFDVLGSDFRYQRKDLATYLAYLTKQGKKANKEIWEAQKAYLEQQLGQEEEPDQVLEPLVTIDPDAFSLEVFSADQSSYARLAISATQFSQRAAAHGSATLAITQAFIDRFERLRSWQPVEFTAATDAQADASVTSTHKTRLVPLAWLRNFVQVQAAATLPAVVASLEPIDLYNLLFILRTRAARKPPRGIRFELVPGARPRLVIEPFEIVLECHGEVYSGSTPRVIRIFGRQRLLALARALPHAHSVKVHLLGAGLPIFWVLDFGAERGTLTVGYTGWTDSGWSSASAFDALMPPPSIAPLALRTFTHLREHGPTALDAMVKALGGASVTDVRAALQYESIKGRVLYDLARGEYRPRLLLAEPIDVASIRYGGERESLAHRLLGDEAKPSGHVRITKLHDLGDESVEISGEVEDTLARRTFAPRFVLDGEGRVRGASCSCLHFKRSGMREGPCEHLLALRIHHQRQQLLDEAARNTAEGRALIRAETRTLIRRRGMKEVVYRVSLDQRLVQVDWGQRGATARQQRTWFESDGAAREAYFARLSALNAEGYIDQRTES